MLAQGTLFGVNHIVGGIRLGQLRSEALPCAGSVKDLQFASGGKVGASGCFKGTNGEFDVAAESKRPFGTNTRFLWDETPGMGKLFIPLAEERVSGGGSEDSDASGFTTFEEDWFPAPAFAVVLPNPRSQNAFIDAAASIQKVIDGQYIDRFTRLVTLQFNLANPSLDVFMPMTMYAELPVAGGYAVVRVKHPPPLMLLQILFCAQGYKYNVVRLYQITANNSTNSIALEVAVALFYLYFFLRIVRSSLKKGVQYLFKARTLIQIVSMVFYGGMWWARYMSLETVPPIEELQVDSNLFFSLEIPASYRSFAVLLSAINSFLVVFTLADYLSGFGTLQVVTGSLYKSLRPSLSFFIIFIVVFVGFAIAHLMIFGQELEQFRTMGQSSYTLMMALLGDIPVEEMRRINPGITPVLTIGYISVCAFVVLNIFIAIVTEVRIFNFGSSHTSYSCSTPCRRTSDNAKRWKAVACPA